MECVFDSQRDLSGKGISALVIGRVVRAAIDANYMNGSEKKYGPDGFMYYLYDLDDLATGDKGTRKVASLNVIRNA